MPPERNIETCTWSVEPCCPGRGSHHRSGSILHHRNGGGRLYGTGHHTVLCHCRTGMLLRRTMLCGICIHDTRSRQRIHLLVCHDGRTHRLDYRVGPGIGIHRSRNHGKHQLEPLSGRLSRGTGHTSTASPHRLSLGWWSRKYPRLPYRRADEPLPDTGYGRQLHLQRLHCIPEGFRHTDFVILGWKYINTDNYTPYIPANTGVLGEYGFSGILRGAAIVFFAFLGFDAVSTAAQETKNPKRNMPIGILVSLLVCTVLYMVLPTS